MTNTPIDTDKHTENVQVDSEHTISNDRLGVSIDTDDVDKNIDLVNIAYKIVPLPSGCANCWGDLGEGCSQECHNSSARHSDKIKEVVKLLADTIAVSNKEAYKKGYIDGRISQITPDPVVTTSKQDSYGNYKIPKSWVKVENVYIWFTALNKGIKWLGIPGYVYKKSNDAFVAPFRGELVDVIQDTKDEFRQLQSSKVKELK